MSGDERLSRIIKKILLQYYKIQFESNRDNGQKAEKVIWILWKMQRDKLRQAAKHGEEKFSRNDMEVSTEKVEFWLATHTGGEIMMNSRLLIWLSA